MKPSFFSLFKRGLYLSAPDDGDDSKEAKKLREERERFAVAALAFCLRYDEGFRKHFWERICRVPGDPDQIPRIDSNDVAIEPPAWADLTLTSATATGSYLWVVETKAGAVVQPKQNPKNPEFLKEGHGYGALLVAHKPASQTRLRYIVLGAMNPLGILDGEECLGITVQERSWGQLLDGVSRQGIVKDLIETFAELRIGEFYMEKAKTIVVTGGITNAIDAVTVLDAICEKLRVGKRKKDFVSFKLEDGTGSFGYYVNQPQENASKEYLDLQKATRTNGCIAWLGYELDAGGNTKKAVWFYFDSEKKCDDLVRKLKKRFETVPDRDETYCAHVTSPLQASERDFDWFESVINFAINQ